MRKMYAQDTLRIRRGEERNERGSARASKGRRDTRERVRENREGAKGGRGQGWRDREARGEGRGRERERDILIVKKTVCVRRRREIRWTRMRTLLCPKRAYTVGTLMSARMKAWAFLCLSFVKLPQ